MPAHRKEEEGAVQRFDGGAKPFVSKPRAVGVPPLPPHGVFGRDEAITDLRARLTRGEGVALTALRGLPGVGKTTLATALAHDDAVRKHFGRGGVYWAALGPQGDAESALHRWADALGEELGGAGDAREKARRVAMLDGAPVLLVIDDVWAWDHVKPFKEVAFPGCVQVCTTRDASIARRFAPRETWVGELPEDEAVAFLGDRCPEAVDADAEGVRALARAVGGLPLGLSLMTRACTNAQYRARSEARHASLAEQAGHDDAPGGACGGFDPRGVLAAYWASPSVQAPPSRSARMAARHCCCTTYSATVFSSRSDRT